MKYLVTIFILLFHISYVSATNHTVDNYLFPKTVLLNIENIGFSDKNVNKTYRGGITLLHYSLTSEKWGNLSTLQVLKILIANGADIHAKTLSKETPLHYAAYFSRSSEIIEFIIQQGADVNAMTHEKSTPLDYAYRGKKSDEVISILKLYGAKSGLKN